MGRVARWLAFLFLLAAATCGPAQAATVFLEELTWTELRDGIVAGKTTVIVPIGGTEQNGPHMALGKHNVRVKALAQKIAQALGNALVAPVVAYVPEGSGPAADGAHALSRDHHGARCDVRAGARVRRRRASSLHGFRDIVFIGDHGEYQKSLTATATRLNREWAASAVRAHAIVEYYAATKTYARALKGRGYSDTEIGTHAGLADTSLALAIDPALVRRDKLAPVRRAARPTACPATPAAVSRAGPARRRRNRRRTIDAIRRATVRR